MHLQLEVFKSDKDVAAQRLLLNELLEFKRSEIEHNEFNNFYGTTAEIARKRLEVNKKVDNYRQKVMKCFPDIL